MSSCWDGGDVAGAASSFPPLGLHPPKCFLSSDLITVVHSFIYSCIQSVFTEHPWAPRPLQFSSPTWSSLLGSTNPPSPRAAPPRGHNFLLDSPAQKMGPPTPSCPYCHTPTPSPTVGHQGLRLCFPYLPPLLLTATLVPHLDRCSSLPEAHLPTPIHSHTAARGSI